MSGKKFPYTLFITDKNLSLYNSNMISSSTKKSILENYHNQISNFMKEKNIKLSDVDNNNILSKIDNIFNNDLINSSSNKIKYEDFSKELLYYKYLLINIRENILVFNLVRTKIKDRILKNNLSYINPLIIKNIDDILIGNNKFFKEKIDIYNNNDKKIYMQSINNIFYGHRFNIGLPSVGSIYSFYENPNGTNIPQFIISMLNCNDNFMDNLPLIKQNIAETISSILLTKNESKLNNIDNILDENLNTNMNNNTRKNLENYFKGVIVELKDIMQEPSSKYIKKDYIIPFKYNQDKHIFEYQEKMSYRLDDDDKSIKLLMMNNLNLLYSTMKSDGTFKIELTDTKIILCCFLFFTINLFYDVYKYYINSLNQTIIDLSDSRGKKFKDLNIEAGFDFIKKLNESLLNFKLILLNNFYELFEPSKISSNYYGMYKNKNGFFVPESKLLVENEVLNKVYPFRKIDDSVKDNLKIIDDKESQKLISNFILFKQKDKDLYDIERNLDLGVFTYNDIITSRTLNMYYSFFENYEKIINFNLFIIDLLMKNFKERMPIECINQSLAIIKPNINTLNRTYLDNQKNGYRSIVKNNFVKLYNESMRKSAVYTSKYLKVESNLVTSGKKSLEKEKETYSLIASMYYIRSEFINNWIKNIKDNRLKNQLTEEFNKIKKNINKLLSKKAKALKKVINKSKKNNSSYTRNNSIEIRVL
jgi:hypothetical protein